MVKKLLLIIIILSLSSTGCFSLTRSYKVETLLKKSEAYKKKRRYSRALRTLREAMEIDETNKDIWFTLGDIYFTVEDYRLATFSYLEALKFHKDAYEAYAGLWITRLEEEGYNDKVKNEVKKEVEEFITSGREEPDRLMAAYYTLYALHEEDLATSLLKRIMNLKPDSEITSVLSNHYFESILLQKDPHKRLEMIEEYRQVFPEGRERYMVNYLRMKIASKDLEDKDMMYRFGEEWIREEPDSRRANFYAGYFYTEEDIALKKAISYLEKALRLIETPDPEEKPLYYPESDWLEDLKKAKGIYYDILGFAYYKIGEFERAEEAYQMAMQYNNYTTKFHYHLGLLLEEKGKIDEAIDAYVRALKYGENKEANERLETLTDTYLDIEGPIYKFFAEKEGITFFTDITEDAGLAKFKAIRVAWGDYDNDGYEDILLNGSILLKNKGGKRFLDVTELAGIGKDKRTRGGIWGDYDNDGYLDFYTLGSRKNYVNRLWKNNQDGTFLDVTSEAFSIEEHYPSEGASWGDYDGDGYIDLYVANYEKSLSTTVSRGMGTPDQLFHNRGDGTFEEISASSGIMSMENMCGRGVSWGDYDNDGDMDIYVTNYRLDPNFLWQNMGDGTFIDIAEEAGVRGNGVEGYFGHSIGAAWGDYDNDGDLDLFVSNLAHPRYIGFSDKSMLLENLGPPYYRFRDRFKESGIRFEETSADPSFVDYDNDGILDLFFTSVYKGRKSFLYKGNGDGTFTDVTWLAGVRVDNGWGNAFADFDNDGDLDLLVASSNGVRLFRNEGNDNHWLHVRVIGRDSNRMGIGTRITIFAPSSLSPKQIREVEGGKGSGSQHSLPVEFGLGKYNGPVDMEIRFPSGRLKIIKDVQPDQMVVVEER